MGKTCDNSKPAGNKFTTYVKNRLELNSTKTDAYMKKILNKEEVKKQKQKKNKFAGQCIQCLWT